VAAGRAKPPGLPPAGRGRDPGLAITAHYAVLPAFTRVRFGQWPEMLRHTPPPDVPGPYALALWHYARGTAHAHLREPEAAQQELHKLQQLSADPALDRVKVKNINPGQHGAAHCRAHPARRSGAAGRQSGLGGR
jgi:hypothetical protein